jgi:hypothetical protein
VVNSLNEVPIMPNTFYMAEGHIDISPG